MSFQHRTENRNKYQQQTIASDHKLEISKSYNSKQFPEFSQSSNDILWPKYPIVLSYEIKKHELCFTIIKSIF